MTKGVGLPGILDIVNVIGSQASDISKFTLNGKTTNMIQKGGTMKKKISY